MIPHIVDTSVIQNIFMDKHKKIDSTVYTGTHYFVIKQNEHFNNI